MYVIDDQHLLMVATDRISAFDVVFGEPIPDKGRVLTAMTVWWSDYLAPSAQTHLVSADPADFPEAARRPEWTGRALLVRKAEMLPLECIVHLGTSLGRLGRNINSQGRCTERHYPLTS